MDGGAGGAKGTLASWECSAQAEQQPLIRAPVRVVRAAWTPDAKRAAAGRGSCYAVDNNVRAVNAGRREV